MNASGSMPGNRGFARFACDFCRQKKLKCSRELPKCNTCKPWPGGCEYSRDQPPSSVQNSQDSMLSGAEASATAPSRYLASNHIDSRPHEFERALSADFTASPQDETASIVDGPTQTAISPDSHYDLSLHRGPTHSFSFLKETPAIIEETMSQDGSDTVRKNAHSELRWLSTALTASQLSSDAGEGGIAFHVPSKPAGYRLISQFFEQADISQLFFTIPPDDLVRQVIFEPQLVKEKAWIAYINYMLLCASLSNPEEDEEAAQLRSNTQLALHNSNIFLLPCEANVQALALLTMHGEDYAAPNLSWMLLGHACRQAEALGLHTPGHHAFESRQRRLCLFWLLFILDKSCSLAFGRPVSLSTVFYGNVPLPDDRYLLKFRPHEMAALGNSQAPPQDSSFGAHFFRQSIEIAKLTGSAMDVLARNDPLAARNHVRSELETWFKNMNQVLVRTMETESASASANQLQEMALGINTFRFQYLHILILLLKGDESQASLRTSSSREAISILPSMVSNWSSVYNGVIWQLLYYPFTPFFVVFENIIRHKGTVLPMIEHDLSLLSTTVTYFVDMRSQVRTLAAVCSRLEHVAAAFLQLALSHVNQGTAENNIGKTNRKAFTSDDDQEGDTVPSYDHKDDSFTPMDGVEPHTAHYLEWLPADMDTSWLVFEPERHNPSTFDSADVGGSSQQMDVQGGRRMFDSTFDWFSWDSYYTDIEAQR